MITVSLIGGLGNQMFQYAAGKALAERHGVPLALDISGFRDYALRPFLLDRLLVPEAIASRCRPSLPRSPKKILRAPSGRHGSIACSERPACRSLRRRQTNIASRISTTIRPSRRWAPQTSLFGYFQSERYFSSIAGNLRDWFSPREPLGDAAAAALTRIEASRLPVSVHVRRGDYLNPGTHEVPRNSRRSLIIARC